MAFRQNKSAASMNSGSSYEKVVKLACKPKATPPKAKATTLRLQQHYLDPIISATWADDGAVSDVCRAIAPRLREPNSIIVFKALIVLHTMMRSGSTDNVLSCLSSSDILRLSNVTDGQWEGYVTPENIRYYAKYMDARIKAYGHLKHDAIRVQSESNRDHRATSEDGRLAGGASGSALSRGRTVVGRKLRVMSVEKGLLRETKIVQKMVAALLQCKFYLDNLEDELVITALRLLVKDLLVLFQAVNEGVINVLEHYFEMSHLDASTALSIYKHFCEQTKEVVEYLAVAKKLQNILNVPVPNLKHAPVSLVKALEEYLNDPNFDQNRLEYRQNKAVADNNPKALAKASKDAAAATATAPATSPTSKPSAQGSAPGQSGPSVTDFFSSIEQEQQSMFNPQTNSPSATYFQQQAAYNPFAARQSMALTGVNQFGQLAPIGFQATGSPFLTQPMGQLQPQPTGFLQPQMTGSNPFRQSMMIPQTTGIPQFGATNTFGAFSPSVPQPSQSVPPMPQTSPFMFSPASLTTAPSSIPTRPQSTPIPAQPQLKPVVSHTTGSKNPFGIPKAPSPPVPKLPTMNQIATGNFGNDAFGNFPASASPAASPPPREAFSSSPPVSSGTFPVNTSGMSSIASAFSATNTDAPPNSEVTPMTSSPFPSGFGQAAPSSPFGSGPASPSALQPQPTGITAFKPSSSFGASLLDSLPPIAGAVSSPPSGVGALSPTQQQQPSVSPFGSPASTQNQPFGAVSSQSTSPFGTFGTRNPSSLAPISEAVTGNAFNNPTSPLNSTVGYGLRPQPTGLDPAANPFRASMMSGGSAPATGTASTGFGSGAFGSFPTFTPTSSFGQSQVNGGALNAPNSNLPNQQQQQANPLISFI